MFKPMKPTKSDRKRKNNISVYYAPKYDDDLDRVHAAAARAGMGLSDFCRQAIAHAIADMDKA